MLLTMTVVTVAVLAVTLWLLYRTVYDEARNRVIDLAHSQVRLIQAVTRFDGAYSQADHTDGSLGATLSQIMDAHTQHHLSGDGIEIEIARREGDAMVLLLDPIGDSGKFETLPWDSEFGAPLRRALEGQSGTMESVDHRGEFSLTAYVPVPELEIAIVAKIDIGQIRAPFLKAALLAGAGATAIFGLGIFLFRRIGNPILERIEQTVERLNKSQRIARLGNWELDLRTNELWWSDETYRLLGVDQDTFHPNLETFTKLIHPEDRALAHEHTVEATQTGMPFKYDHRVVLPDGSIRTLHEQCTVTTDTLGNPVLLTGTAQDVTEKREFETLTTRFGRIIEQSANEMYVFDSETLKFVQVNSGARKNLGYTMDELRDITAIDIKPEVGPEKFAALIRPLLQGVTDLATFQTVHRRKDGTTYPVDVKLQLMRTETPPLFLAVIEDITERQKAENTLRASEQRFQNLSKISPVGVFYTDPDGGCEYVNDTWCKLTGLDRHAAMGTGWFGAIHPDDQNDIAIQWEQKAQSGNAFNAEYRFLHGDSSVVWVKGQTAPQFDDDANIVGYVGTITDITARKRAEADLQEVNENLERHIDERTQTLRHEIDERKFVEGSLKTSEERVRMILDNAVDGIVTIDERGAVQSFNPAAERLFGWKAREIIDQNVRTLMPDTNAQGHDDSMERYRETGIRTVIGNGREVVGKRKNGEEFPLYLAVSESSAGRSGLFTGILRDLTAEKAAENALRTKTALVQLLHTVSSAANEATSVLAGMQTCIDAVCDYAACPVGHLYLVSEGIPDTLVAENVWHLDDPYRYAVLKATLEDASARPGAGLAHKVLETRQPVWHSDLSDQPIYANASDPDGGSVQSGFAFPILSGQDIVAVFEFFALDIREPDELLMDTLGNIGAQIGQLIQRERAERDLQDAKRQAEVANHSKSDFLSSMSHELRTPMNAVLGFGQLLESDPDEPLSPLQAESVEQILKGGHHLLGLIDQVLDLAKIESGKLTISLEPVAPRDVFDECLSLAHTLADKRKIEIIDKTATLNLPYLHVDHMRFKQVLLNLLSNAVKYNRLAGTITLEAYPVDDLYWRINVTDTGQGIPKDRHVEVFRPFSRMDAENSDIEGTGIGLTITKQLVELMEGRIGFDSSVGIGSTFWFELPAEKSEDQDALDMSDIESEVANTLTRFEMTTGTILYVEDNPANLFLMERIVARFPNVEMLSAHTAELGLELAITRKPDIIFMDINLPGMDGFQALEQLQLAEETRGTPVIALSANAMPREIERGHAAGFKDYLTKPIKVKEVVSVITETIGEAE